MLTCRHGDIEGSGLGVASRGFKVLGLGFEVKVLGG